MDDKVIEAALRASCKHDGGDPDRMLKSYTGDPVDYTDEHDQDWHYEWHDWSGSFNAALTALTAAGYGITAIRKDWRGIAAIRKEKDDG